VAKAGEGKPSRTARAAHALFRLAQALRGAGRMVDKLLILPGLARFLAVSCLIALSRGLYPFIPSCVGDVQCKARVHIRLRAAHRSARGLAAAGAGLWDRVAFSVQAQRRPVEETEETVETQDTWGAIDNALLPPICPRGGKALICCATSRALSASSEFWRPPLRRAMAKRRAREEPSEEKPGRGGDERQRKGFAVGPANLPDGTYRRKGTSDPPPPTTARHELEDRDTFDRAQSQRA